MAFQYDPEPEEQNVVLIEDAAIRKAEHFISGCEACSEDAWMPFDYVLDAVTGSDPTFTDYIMERPARCPRCREEIREKTLIETVTEVDR